MMKPKMRNPAGLEYYPGRRLPAVCRDGVTRSAVITGREGKFDGWNSYPAAVQVYAGGKRRTVSGGIYGPNLNGVFFFQEDKGKANAGLIPWTAYRPRLARIALRLIKATAYGRGAPGYIWDCPADHSAALARGCILWFATSDWPEGGFAARAVLRRLPPDVLPQLCRFFDKLSMLIDLHDQTEKTPPPPPPGE